MLYFFLFCPRIFDYIEMICYHKKTPAAEVCVNICHPQKKLIPAGGESKAGPRQIKGIFGPDSVSEGQNSKHINISVRIGQ